MSRDLKVYLGGPITGLSYKDGQDWRANARAFLAEFGIKAFSPLRAKDYLSKLDIIPANVAPHITKPLSTAKGIVTRDCFDVATSDALLVNLLDAKIVSIGTMFELGFAWELRKPVVLCMEEGNIHEHPFVTETAGFIVDNLKEGIDTIAKILLP